MAPIRSIIYIEFIVSIAASQIGGAVILVIMYVEIFKTSVIVFISDIKMCLTDNFQYQSQFLRM